jgi:hypothetical protein
MNSKRKNYFIIFNTILLTTIASMLGLEKIDTLIFVIVMTLWINFYADIKNML